MDFSIDVALPWKSQKVGLCSVSVSAGCGQDRRPSLRADHQARGPGSGRSPGREEQTGKKNGSQNITGHSPGWMGVRPLSEMFLAGLLSRKGRPCLYSGV